MQAYNVVKPMFVDTFTYYSHVAPVKAFIANMTRIGPRLQLDAKPFPENNKALYKGFYKITPIYLIVGHVGLEPTAN